MLEPFITDKPGFSVIGLETAFVHALSPEANNLDVIGQLWCEFLERAGSVPNRVGNEMYGIVYSRPENERKHPDEMQYIAAVRVSSTAEVPSGMVALTIPSARYAVFTHKGPIQNIGATVEQIYRVWLPASPHVHADAADVELYDHRFRPEGEDSEMEYCVPIRPK